MLDGEIQGDGFDRRCIGTHNAFLLRRNLEVAEIIAAVRVRQDRDEAERFEAGVVAAKLIHAFMAILGRPTRSRLRSVA